MSRWFTHPAGYRLTTLTVIAGLDPAIHTAAMRILRISMDPRVKPGGDAQFDGAHNHPTRLPNRFRFSFCFALRGASLKRRAAVPPRMLCLPFSDRNGRSQMVDGRSKSQCG